MQKNKYLVYLTGFADIITLVISYFLAFWIRFYSSLIEIKKGIPDIDNYITVLIFIIIISIITFQKNGLFRKDIIPNEYSKIFTSLVIVFFLFVTFTFIYRETTFSRLFILVNFVLSFILLCIDRMLIKKIKLNLFKRSKFLTNILIIADNSTFNRLKEKINPNTGYTIVAHTDNIDSLKNIKKDFDEVIINISNNQEIISKIMDILGYEVKYKIMPQSSEIVSKRLFQFEINNIVLFDLKETNIKGFNRLIKRLFDFILSLILIIIASPLMLIISLLIRIDSKGPIIYKQTRMTYNKKPFTLYKFRSMVDNAENLTGPVWAKNGDPRITKLGRFLRKTNLDELPQFFNVIKGNMSLVGPRPERPVFIEKFKDKIPQYIERHSVKAGMTGWAQVNGFVGNTSLQERIKHDVYYLENWSLLFDVKILLMTLKIIFSQKN